MDALKPIFLTTQLPPEVHVKLVRTMVSMGLHDAVAALGLTSRYWRGVTFEEHPLLMSAMPSPSVKRQPIPPMTLHRAFEAVIRLNSAPLLARFIVEAEWYQGAAVAYTIKSLSEDTITPLMLSARLGFRDVSEALLVYGAKGDVRDPLGRSAASWAFEGKHVELATQLLAHIPTCAEDAVDDEGVFMQAPLEMDLEFANPDAIGHVSLDDAIREGHVLLTREGLQRGEDVFPEQLAEAAATPHAVPIARMLLEQHPEFAQSLGDATLAAVMHQEDPSDWLRFVATFEEVELDSAALLDRAARAGKLAAFQELYRPGEHDINRRGGEDNATYLRSAAVAGQTELVDFLVAQGADHRLSSPISALVEKIARRMNQARRSRTQDSGFGGSLLTRREPEAPVTEIAMAKRLLQLDWTHEELCSHLKTIEHTRALHVASPDWLGEIADALRERGATL